MGASGSREGKGDVSMGGWLWGECSMGEGGTQVLKDQSEMNDTRWAYCTDLRLQT